MCLASGLFGNFLAGKLNITSDMAVAVNGLSTGVTGALNGISVNLTDAINGAVGNLSQAFNGLGSEFIGALKSATSAINDVASTIKTMASSSVAGGLGNLVG